FRHGPSPPRGTRARGTPLRSEGEIMHRFRVWGLSAALAAGAGAPVAAAADPGDVRPPAPQQTTLFAKLFGNSPKPAGPTTRSGPVTGMGSAAPLPPEVLADALRAEQEAYLRRLTVCSELRRVGTEANNDALVR